jgi:ubiquinone/menaquinone biosynthesis C-methylase UbiE
MSPVLVPRRSYEPELMDAPLTDPCETARAMRDLARVNRWLGGVRTLWGPMLDLVRRKGLTGFSMLDIGTGGADVPGSIVGMAAAAGIPARAICVDLDAGTIGYAARHASSSRLEFLRADAFALPFRNRALDFVTSSLMFHHFHESDAARLLAEMARVSRRAVIVNDLRRHLVPWTTIRLLVSCAESGMVRHDGPLSVLRGWTMDELTAVASRAGLAGSARIERRFPYRLVLVVETG